MMYLKTIVLDMVRIGLQAQIKGVVLSSRASLRSSLADDNERCPEKGTCGAAREHRGTCLGQGDAFLLIFQDASVIPFHKQGGRLI